jgi:uncharacterized membrane protein
VIRFEAHEEIGRPAAEVWAYAADISRHPEWMSVTDARIVRGDATRVGALGVERFKLGPRSYDVELVVAEAEPGRRIAWHLNGGSPMRGDVELVLEALGPDRTRATWSGGLGLTGIWRVIEPLIAAEVRSGESAELRRLKDRLEGSTAASAVATA